MQSTRLLTAAAVSALLCAAAPVRATLLAADSFLSGSNPGAGEYSTTTMVGQNPTVTGFTGAWTTPDLTGLYLGHATGLDASAAQHEAGGSVRTLNNVDNTQKRIDHPLAAQTYVDGDTVYFSAIMSIGVDSTTDPDAFAMTRFVDSNTSGFGLAFGFQGGNVTVRYRNTANAIVNAALQTGYAADTPYFFVGKLRINSNSFRDELTVWLNPAGLGTEGAAGTAAFPTAEVAAMTNSAANGSLDYIQFETLNALNVPITFDEVRLGTTFADVAPVPEPASLGAIAIAALALGARRRRGRA